MFRKIYNHIINSRFFVLYALGLAIAACLIVGAVVFICTPGVHLNFPVR